MIFKEIEVLKHKRKKLIALQRLDKYSARRFQTRSRIFHENAVRRVTNRREILRLIEIILRQHNQLKKLYGSKR